MRLVAILSLAVLSLAAALTGCAAQTPAVGPATGGSGPVGSQRPGSSGPTLTAPPGLALRAPGLPGTGPARVAAPRPLPCPKPGTGYLTATPPTSARTVALTFDDGPSQWTPRFLAVLARYGVHGTFFMVGSRAAARPDVVRQVVESGSLVGNHSWTHPLHPALSQLPPSVVTAEIGRAQSELTLLAGSAPCFFRAPGENHRTSYVQDLAHRFGLTVTDTTRSAVDSVDPRNVVYTAAWTSLLVSRLTRAGDHPILLMHDGHADNKVNQLTALPQVIAWYQSRGYTFTDPLGRPFR